MHFPPLYGTGRLQIKYRYVGPPSSGDGIFQLVLEFNPRPLEWLSHEARIIPVPHWNLKSKKKKKKKKKKKSSRVKSSEDNIDLSSNLT
jgi:hypothetical protein